MKIIVVGPYDKNLNRTRILLDGLKILGHDVREHAIEMDPETLFKLSKDADIVFIPGLLHRYVPYISRNVNCPVIFDPLISNWVTNVIDSKRKSKFSLGAFKYRYLDHQAIKHSDIIIADSHERKKMFQEIFDLPESDVKVVYTGANGNNFFPLERSSSSNFEVGCFGEFLPYCGMKKIIEASKKLKIERVRFTLIGKGHEYKEIEKLVQKENTITLKNDIPEEEMNSEINRFDLCLGIFGDSIKATSMITPEIFNYMSAGRPTLTSETMAMKELFTDRKDIFFCDNNSDAIASEIKRLMKSAKELNYVAASGHTLVKNSFNQKKIALQFVEAVKGKIS